MDDNQPTRIKIWHLSLVALTAGGFYAIATGLAHPCLAQAWQGTGMNARGVGSQAGPGNGPGWNGTGYADQHFIVMMIPHHDGAIAMADLALTRAHRPEIKALALSIKTSQTRENAQMRAWYKEWFGQEVPDWPAAVGWGWQGGMAGSMGMGIGPGMGMGMHRGTNLNALMTAKDFDRAFIEQMVPHHQMGVMMASMAQAHSQHPQLLQLQQTMVRVQSEEIRTMEQWYRTWYGGKQ